MLGQHGDREQKSVPAIVGPQALRFLPIPIEAKE
jgi:hypothetical protein